MKLIHIYGKQIKGVWYCGAFENEKVFAVSFGFSENRVLQSLMKKLPYGVMFKQVMRPTVFYKSVVEALSLIYRGEQVSQVFPLNMKRLSKCFQRILKVVAAIPCGYVATYGEIAKVCDTGARVVGGAMASNPFPLLVPCHRVVRSDLTLGGFGLGEKVKLNILEKEQKGFEESSLRFGEKVLTLFPVERVIKHFKTEE